jgi:dTDP-glucose 4,6-dehydratase
MEPSVLVTGAAGFVGSFIVKHILENTTWDVVGLERLSYSGSLDRLEPVVKKYPTRYKSVLHNLQSEINEHVAKEIGYVDYIIHVAANSHVDRSIENPRQFVLDNVLGTCNILELARNLPNLLKFIYFSTDEVFGPAGTGVFYDEDARYNSTNPYSATKAGGEELAVAYRNTYKVPVIITHTMNIFGETQHPEKFIPKCIQKIKNGEIIQIHSDSTKTVAGSRFYIYAVDVANAIMFLIEHGKLEKYNIVGKQEINNYELAKMIADLMNKPLNFEFVDFHSSRPGHDLRYALSSKKLSRLGWDPKYEIKECLYKMICQFKEF